MKFLKKSRRNIWRNPCKNSQSLEKFSKEPVKYVLEGISGGFSEGVHAAISEATHVRLSKGFPGEIIEAISRWLFWDGNPKFKTSSWFYEWILGVKKILMVENGRTSKGKFGRIAKEIGRISEVIARDFQMIS